MGIKKSLLCIGGLMLATGGPISMFSASDFASSVKQKWLASQAATSASAPQSPSDAPAGAGSVTAAIVPVSNRPADQMPTPGLGEVLRFDVSVEWVMRTWPRVSTGLPQLQLQGYRVPLVTGTSTADVAGSLTYYFNSRQQVQRITFRGSTGDPQALVSILAGRYQFARRLTNDPGLLLYEAVDASNKPRGSAKIRSASVVKASQPYSRFDVDLEIDRPEK